MERAIFKIGIQGILYSPLRSYHVRLGTFKNRPLWNSQIKYELAEAGFFYLGIGDKVQCFHCGIGLMNWEHDANPWEEHARHSETCFYLLTIKGENYVQVVRQKFRDIPVRQQSGNERGTILIEAPELSSQNPQDVIEKISTSTPSTSGGNDSNSDDTRSTKSIVKDMKCLTCFEQERNIIFLPCGHVATCAKCVEKLDDTCDICRGIIQSKCLTSS